MYCPWETHRSWLFLYKRFVGKIEMLVTGGTIVMSKIRVYELAKMLGKSNKEMMDLLKDLASMLRTT